MRRRWFGRQLPIRPPRRLYLADGAVEAHLVASTYLQSDQPMVETACGQLEPGPGRLFDEGAFRVDLCYHCLYPSLAEDVPDR